VFVREAVEEAGPLVRVEGDALTVLERSERGALPERAAAAAFTRSASEPVLARDSDDAGVLEFAEAVALERSPVGAASLRARAGAITSRRAATSTSPESNRALGFSVGDDAGVLARAGDGAAMLERLADDAPADAARGGVLTRVGDAVAAPMRDEVEDVDEIADFDDVTAFERSRLGAVSLRALALAVDARATRVSASSSVEPSRAVCLSTVDAGLLGRAGNAAGSLARADEGAGTFERWTANVSDALRAAEDADCGVGLDAADGGTATALGAVPSRADCFACAPRAQSFCSSSPNASAAGVSGSPALGGGVSVRARVAATLERRARSMDSRACASAGGCTRPIAPAAAGSCGELAMDEPICGALTCGAVVCGALGRPLARDAVSPRAVATGAFTGEPARPLDPEALSPRPAATGAGEDESARPLDGAALSRTTRCCGAVTCGALTRPAAGPRIAVGSLLSG
jgi:hypothetical protein